MIRAAILLALAGCTSAAPGGPASTPGPAEARLVEAALRAEAALTRLASVRASCRGEPPAPPPRLVPPALLRPVTADWTGAGDELARQIAARAEFAFEVSGAQPRQPRIVEIRARGRPAILVLRDIGVQIGPDASLTVDAATRTVHLEWLRPKP